MLPEGAHPWLVVAYGLLGLNVIANLLYFAWVQRRARTPAIWPRLSILIPARNEESNLGRLLPTLMGQDYPDFEIVLFDDGSSDGTSGIARALGGDRLRVLRGDGPPAGWIGKPHACHQAAAVARGDVFLFLDADTALRRPDALRRLVARFEGLPHPAVLTGMPRFAGGGLLLVSMLTFFVLLMMPLAVAAALRWRAMGAMNGQCWMMRADVYRRLEPHRTFRNEIVEDVMIGRWLLGQGIVPWASLLGTELTVWMYESLGDAWLGFRKNFYLVSGRSVAGFVASFLMMAAVLLVLPAALPPVLAGLLLVKLLADRLTGAPWWLWPLLPVTVVLALGIYLDSAIAHWRGKVMWKGRSVGL